MLPSRTTHIAAHHSVTRLWWYVWLNRIVVFLAICGFIAIMLGALCIPNGLVSPKGTTSLFNVLSANGAFLKWPRPLFEIGGLLILSSVVMQLVVWVAFRDNGGEGANS
jgi:hypothetical protein